jgi:hypothetical protein
MTCARESAADGKNFMRTSNCAKHISRSNFLARIRVPINGNIEAQDGKFAFIDGTGGTDNVTCQASVSGENHM